MNIFIKKFFTLSISLSTMLFADFSEESNKKEQDQDVETLIKEYQKYKNSDVQEVQDNQNENEPVEELPKAKKPQTKTSSNPEIQALKDEYTKYKNAVESDINIVKNGQINELPELKKLAIKPDLQITIDAIEEGAQKKALQSDAYLYLKRWFLLADEVDSEDKETLFYLILDSHFKQNMAEVESLTINEDFISDQEFMDFIKLGYDEYMEYLTMIAEDFGDIDEKYYNKIKYRVTSKGGLSVQKDPLTGIELKSKKVIPNKAIVYVKYSTRGSDKNFKNSFNKKFAKIEYETDDEKIIGWVDFKSLVKKNR